MRAICEVCGHTRRWHDRAAARPLLGAEPGIERPCYREGGGAPCRCVGFRESGEIAVPPVSASRRPDALRGAQTLALVLVFVVLGLMLLYAYRSQTPSVFTVPMSAAIQDVQAGRVVSVTIAGEGDSRAREWVARANDGPTAGRGLREGGARLQRHASAKSESQVRERERPAPDGRPGIAKHAPHLADRRSGVSRASDTAPDVGADGRGARRGAGARETLLRSSRA